MRPVSIPGLLAGCVLLSSILLSGCGGGGDGSDSSTGGVSDPPGSSTNAAPKVSGAPGTAVVGQAYSFQPAATDADGDKLSFTVANLPSWASFSNQTGRITGTPTAAQVGSYANITITVSDGATNATFGPFEITVSEVGTGSATLSWMPPTENTNGSALSDLAGYEVHYGRSADDLDRTVSLGNPSINNYVVENLSSGTWYFAVIAVNTSGGTSPLSNTASKTVS
jgi:hypothetical protein